LLMLGISTSLMVTLKWFRDGEVQKTLEKERLASELSLLKTQINPHFFFNTLNNIYALTEVDPKVAQEAIYNLSKMMRYMLYETENDRVLLSKEIDFIRNYVELMRLRLSDSVKVDFGYPVEVGNAIVAPLVLITFIENAFKHGVSYNEKSYVRSELSVVGNQLKFSICNPLLHSAHATRLEASGIGLSNVQRRLNLLYPQRHELLLETTENEFSVHLTIQLL
jgi:two-component system, LytTR family, sensor kinase